MRTLNYYMATEDGPKLLGHFVLDDDDALTYINTGQTEPVSKEMFVRLFHESYPLLEDDVVRVVLLSDAKVYFERLMYRFKGYTWVEEAKEQ